MEIRGEQSFTEDWNSAFALPAATDRRIEGSRSARSARLDDGEFFLGLVEVCRSHIQSLISPADACCPDCTAVATIVFNHFDLVASEVDLTEVVEAAVLGESGGNLRTTRDDYSRIAHDAWIFWQSTMQ